MGWGEARGPKRPVDRLLADIGAVLRTANLRYRDEVDLHGGIAEALTAAGFDVAREVKLGRLGRIDMVVDRVGIEVKVDGGTAAVRRQVIRYTESDQLDAVLLVTNRARHGQMPTEANGKPVRVLAIFGIM